MAEQWPIIGAVDFSTMSAPALVVVGDKDDPRHFTDRGPDWHADAYTLAPGPKALLTLFGAEHGLGGSPGTTPPRPRTNPERVAALARLTTAYLRTQLHPGSPAWPKACEALTTETDPVGRVASKEGPTRAGAADQRTRS